MKISSLITAEFRALMPFHAKQIPSFIDGSEPDLEHADDCLLVLASVADSYD